MFPFTLANKPLTMLLIALMPHHCPQLLLKPMDRDGSMSSFPTPGAMGETDASGAKKAEAVEADVKADVKADAKADVKVDVKADGYLV